MARSTAKPQDNAPAIEVPQYTPGVWQVMKMTIASFGQMLMNACGMVNWFLMAGEKVGHTSYVMAESNDRVVQISTKGREHRRLQELRTEFPELEI